MQGEKKKKKGEQEDWNMEVACYTETGKFSLVPIQYQVRCKDEFARVVDGPPDESYHQHLQPWALQQLNLVMEGQLQET